MVAAGQTTQELAPEACIDTHTPLHDKLAIEREGEIYHLGWQRRQQIMMSHTVFVVSRHFKRSALLSRWMKERDSFFLERAISLCSEEFKENFRVSCETFTYSTYVLR